MQVKKIKNYKFKKGKKNKNVDKDFLDLSKFHKNKIVADDFICDFSKGEIGQMDMKQFLVDLEKKSRWEVIRLADLNLNVIQGGPLELESIKKQHNLKNVSDDAILSTTESSSYNHIAYHGSQFLLVGSKYKNMSKKNMEQLNIFGELESIEKELEHVKKRKFNKLKNKQSKKIIVKYLLSSNAIEDLKERLRCNCPCTTKYTKEQLQQHINLSTQVALDKEVLMLHRFEKIRTFHGLNTYTIFPQDQIFECLEKILDRDFDGAEFLGGFYSHEKTFAQWEIANQKDKLLSTYIETTKRITKTDISHIVPMISFKTSDTGDSSVTIQSYLKNGRMNILIGTPIVYSHQSLNTLEGYNDLLQGLYAKFQNMIDQLEKLLTIEIKNPINTLIYMLIKCKFLKSYALKTIELYQDIWNDGNTVTAHDIFMVMQEILSLMQEDEKIAKTTYELCSENTCKLIFLENIWKDADTTICHTFK